MDVGTAESQAAFIADCEQNADRRVQLDVDFAMAIVVVSQIQLALRHPNNTGASAANARAFVKRLIGRLALTDTIRRVLEAGFDQKYDQVRPFSQPRKKEPPCPEPPA